MLDKKGRVGGRNVFVFVFVCFFIVCFFFVVVFLHFFM